MQSFSTISIEITGVLAFIILIAMIVLLVPVSWCQNSTIKYSLINRRKNAIYKQRHTKHHIPLDKDACHRNLKDFKSVMQRHGILFWISEGTALGAVRANDFIDHDDDVDVGVWSSYRKVFEQNAIPDLKEMNFKVDGVSMNGTFIMMSRSKEKIDIDITGPSMTCMAAQTYHAHTDKCNDIIPLLKNLSLVSLRDELYPCPGSAYLEFLYGPDWMTPQRRK